MSNRAKDQEADMVHRAGEILKNIYDQNKEFNRDLDGDTPLEFSSLKDTDGDYKIERSEALFWSDRVSYDDELIAWNEQQMTGKHEDSVELLKANGHMGLFRELIEAIHRNRIVPFIGAGMSFASDFPLWDKTLLKIKGRIEDGLDEKAFQDAMDRYDYLEAADLLWKADDMQVKAVIRSRFARSEIPKGGPKGPIQLLDKISRGCIVTTNYDRIIETVDTSIDGYMHGLQQGHNFVPNLIRGERCLLKLHGDTDSADSLVFTKSQYDEAYGTPFDYQRPLPRALRQIFIGHSLLFLGCSLLQDRTLELFEHIIQNGEFEVPDHFAILSEPENGETRIQKENRLLKMKIRPIWYPSGEHQFVEGLLKLAIDASEEVFTL